MHILEAILICYMWMSYHSEKTQCSLIKFIILIFTCEGNFLKISFQTEFTIFISFWEQPGYFGSLSVKLGELAGL